MAIETITAETIRRYRVDGAVLIKQVLPEDCLTRLARGLDQINAVSGDMTTRNTTKDGRGRFMLDQYPSFRNADLRSIVENAGLGQIAAALMQCGIARYVLDQAFYKEPGFIQETAWHQDSPFMNVRGNDLARLWVSCDPSPREVTVRVIRGSHLWNVLYQPSSPDEVDIREVESAKFSYYAEDYDNQLPKIPDFNRHLEAFDVLSWDVEPGDVLAFNANIIHGAGGLAHHPSPRRALAILWGGDDVVYWKRPGQGLPDRAQMKGVDITDGTPIARYPDIFAPMREPADVHF